MLRTMLCILLIAGPVSAQAGNPQTDAQIEAFKKEVKALQTAVDDAVTGAMSGGRSLQPAKATYLEGFGPVVTIEVAFEPTANPFNSPKSPSELKKIVADRKAAVQQKLERLVKQQVTSLASVGPTDSIAIVLYLFNSNPVDLPGQPSQIVFTAKKQDPDHVSIREFR